MKYLSQFESFFVPFGDYIVGDNIKDLKIVKNFIGYYKLNDSVLNVYKGMLEKYNEYPLKLDTTQLMYKTKDGCLLKLKLKDNKILEMEKYKKELKDSVFKNTPLFEGKYTWEMFEYLYIGTKNESFDPETLEDGYYEHSEEAYIRRIPDTKIRNQLLMIYRKNPEKKGPYGGHYHCDNLEQALNQIAFWGDYPNIPWKEILARYKDNLLDSPV